MRIIIQWFLYFNSVSIFIHYLYSYNMYNKDTGKNFTKQLTNHIKTLVKVWVKKHISHSC